MIFHILRSSALKFFFHPKNVIYPSNFINEINFFLWYPCINEVNAFIVMMNIMGKKNIMYTSYNQIRTKNVVSVQWWFEPLYL